MNAETSASTVEKKPAAAKSSKAKPADRPGFLRRLNFANLRIGRKIGLGFAIVLAMTVAVSFLGWNGQRQVSRQLERTDATALLYNELQEIRKDEKNYQISGNEQFVKDALGKIATLKEHAEAMKALFDSEEDIQAIDRVRENVENYETALTRYSGIERQKQAALESMLQKSAEMAKTSAQMRADQNIQFGALAKKQGELEDRRDSKMAVSDSATKTVGMITDLFVEMQKFQIGGEAKQAEDFDRMAYRVQLSLKDIKALLGDGTDITLPDEVNAKLDAMRKEFKKFADSVVSGGISRTSNIAVVLQNQLHDGLMAIKSEFGKLAFNQRLEWENLTDEATLAKFRMQDKQAITLQASTLIDGVNHTRFAQMQYLREATSKKADEVREGIANIVGLLAELEKKLDEPEEVAKVATIRDDAKAYLEEFENVVRFFAQQEAADAAMVEAAQAVNGEVGRATSGQKAAMTAQQDQSAFLSIAGSSSALVLGVLFAFFISRSITGPLSYITGNMRRLAEGDTSIVVRDRDLKNEIGDLSRTMQVFLEKTVEMARMREEQAEKDRRAEEEKKAAMIKMADQFETSVGEVVERVATAATDMTSSSEAMSATAEETTRQASAVAAASEQASANVETVASAAEELSSSIAEISRQVAQASQIASGAVRQAEATNAKVQGLAEAANKIGEVVALITDIAEQTNLLALNATIEAARAGDAGKGFAVVASEVKNLANQTAKATDEIGAQITGIQTATQEAVSAIQEIVKTITEIDEVNSGVAAAVEQQGAATQEIARNVEQAATGTQEVSSNIGGVSQAANETGTAATQIHQAASGLSRESDVLRREVDKFLAGVRAA